MQPIKIITKATLCLAILPLLAFADDGVNIVIAPDGGGDPYCYGYDCYYGSGAYYYGGDGYHDGHYNGYHDGHNNGYHDGHNGGHNDAHHH
jgi:hypothetical protein